jgi:cytochrome c oxidase subunit 2
MSRSLKLILPSAAAVLAGAGLFPPGPNVRAVQEPKVISITAKRFEFTPKEITLKKGETVKLQLKSEDVTHGFYSKPLGLDEDIEAGTITEVTLTPQAPGKYTTICDHFCGVGHGNMKITIIVE